MLRGKQKGAKCACTTEPKLLILYTVSIDNNPNNNCLPVCLVVVFFSQAGIKDTQSHENAKEILLTMGEFFQIQVKLFCGNQNLF